MKPTVILALDGLNREELFAFATFSNRLHSIATRAAILENDQLLCNSSSVWATLLTGKSWREHGCTNFSIAGSTLSDPVIASEEHLASAPTLLLSLKQEHTAVINVPLLKPRNRLWLGSSGPEHFSVYPPELREKLSGVAALSSKHRRTRHKANPDDLFEEAVELDIVRLSAIVELSQLNQVEAMICRLSSFDTGGHHLYGELFAEQNAPDQRLRLLKRLGEALENALSELATRGIAVALVSNYSFTACKRVVNINHLLEAGGFCKTTLHSSSLRIRALQSLSPQSDSLRWHIDVENTLACSLSHGTIHINSKNRFKNGLVESMQVASLKQELIHFLPAAAEQRYGMKLLIEECNGSNFLPDLAFTVPGADYTFSRDALEYDVPSGVHCPTGFICLPDGETEADAKIFSASEASVKLQAFIRAGITV